MNEIILDTIIKIVCSVVVTLLGVLGSWLLTKLGKQQKLANVTLALSEAMAHTETTVMELEQVYVNRWKAASEDGKLTEGEKNELHALLLDGTKAKLSDASYKILSAAGTDLTALILGAGEAVLQRMRR